MLLLLLFFCFESFFSSFSSEEDEIEGEKNRAGRKINERGK